MAEYIVTRQNADGSYDSVGMNNRCIIRGYKLYRNAFKYGINPFGSGRMCRVEEYSNVRDEKPRQVFHTVTFAHTRGA
jgi:hypothetical protein